MPEFRFIENSTTGKYVISAPRRAERPDETKGKAFCPFCDIKEEILYSKGEVKVLANKFPFAPIHEVIVHSNDHSKNFGDLDLKATQNIFEVFRERFEVHNSKGQVYIFHNKGIEGGESLSHPHSQLVVIPEKVELDIPKNEVDQNTGEMIQSNNYYIFCPESSEWPYEVWIAPFKNNNTSFKDTNETQLEDLSIVITRIVKGLEQELGKDFPYNFYIYPKEKWYLRITPRMKKLGGFEIGTKVFVNTEEPQKVIDLLKPIFAS